MRIVAAVLAAGLLGCGSKTADLAEGTYTMCREVSGYSGETIEMKDGQFRYWFYSDAGSSDVPEYPLKGAYHVSGDILTLAHPKIHDPSRTLAVVNGAPVLWRKDGLALWQKEERLHPYAVLIRMNGWPGDPEPKARPSIESLKSAKLQDQEEKEYQERFNDQPAEVRVLLRARSLRNDSNMETYRKEIARARIQPDPKLVAQLVALMGHDSHNSIDAEYILNDLYKAGWLVKDDPPFMKDPGLRKKGLETLIDGLSRAPDRKALEQTIMQFLRVTETKKIDLPIDATGHRIKLEALPSGESYGCEGPATDDVKWLKSISKIIPPCQKWMRDQLEK